MKIIRILTAAAVLTLAPAAQASFGDFLKQWGSLDFGSEFDPADMTNAGNQRNWAERDRWVNEALEKAYQALGRADREIDLYDYQNYLSILKIEWTPEFLMDRANVGNLNAYATFTEYLSRYLKVKQELIESIAELNRHYAVLKQVDPKQLTGPFQLNHVDSARSYTDRAAGAIDSTAHQAALATSAGTVEKHTRELEKAIDYGIELEKHFRKAADMD